MLSGIGVCVVPPSPPPLVFLGPLAAGGELAARPALSALAYPAPIGHVAAFPLLGMRDNVSPEPLGRGMGRGRGGIMIASPLADACSSPVCCFGARDVKASQFWPRDVCSSVIGFRVLSPILLYYITKCLCGNKSTGNGEHSPPPSRFACAR